MADPVRTFNWPVKHGTPGETDQKVLESQFGDGYTQRSGMGINNASGSYEVSITATRARVEAVRAFLLDHGGWRSFLWTPKLGEPGLYVSKRHQITPLGNDVFTLTTTFVQTFKP